MWKDGADVHARTAVQVFNMVLGLKIKQHRMRSTLVDNSRLKVSVGEHHGSHDVEEPRAALG